MVFMFKTKSWHFLTSWNFQICATRNLLPIRWQLTHRLLVLTHSGTYFFVTGLTVMLGKASKPPQCITISDPSFASKRLHTSDQISVRKISPIRKNRRTSRRVRQAFAPAEWRAVIPFSVRLTAKEPNNGSSSSITPRK